MSDIVNGKATICIVNYKTPELIRLCLRSIRKFTHYPYEVIVIDNDSGDASLEYLKSLKWIKLIERRANPSDTSGGQAHASGLDLGLENCNTEFFVSMHSDTFVQKENWLNDLIGFFENDNSIACVGSGKLELLPSWRLMLKKITDLRTHKRKLLREPDPLGKYRYYNRTICCAYRTEILKRENLTFTMGQEMKITGGKKLYFELVDRGYKTVALPPATMRKYVVHLAHATQVVNRDEFTVRDHTIERCYSIMNRVMNSEAVRTILTDESLDQ